MPEDLKDPDRKNKLQIEGKTAVKLFLLFNFYANIVNPY